MAAALMVAGTASQAQDTSDNRVAVKTDWNVFVDDNPTECWSVSKPKSSSATIGNIWVGGEFFFNIFLKRRGHIEC